MRWQGAQIAGNTATAPVAIPEQAIPAAALEANRASGSPGAPADASASGSSPDPPRLIAGPAPRSTICTMCGIICQAC